MLKQDTIYQNQYVTASLFDRGGTWFGVELAITVPEGIPWGTVQTSAMAEELLSNTLKLGMGVQFCMHANAMESYFYDGDNSGLWIDETPVLHIQVLNDCGAVVGWVPQNTNEFMLAQSKIAELRECFPNIMQQVNDFLAVAVQTYCS